MAPMTNKEKSIGFRRKLKEDVHKHMRFKEKDAKRKKRQQKEAEKIDWAFLKELIQWLRNAYSALKSVSIFSDGCAAQFKNKFTLSNLCHFQEDFDISGYWNFFATSHGKGAVDGVGGKLKRVAWEMVKSRKLLINDSEEFFNALNGKTNINLIYVSSQKIQDNKNMLTTRWESILPIAGLQSCHFFRPVSEKMLEIGQTHQNNIRNIPITKH